MYRMCWQGGTWGGQPKQTKQASSDRLSAGGMNHNASLNNEWSIVLLTQRTLTRLSFVFFRVFCAVWRESPRMHLNLTTEKGKKGLKKNSCTFNGSPLGLPAQQPPAIDLVLLVTAHHRKGDHLLLKHSRWPCRVSRHVLLERHKYDILDLLGSVFLNDSLTLIFSLIILSSASSSNSFWGYTSIPLARSSSLIWWEHVQTKYL